MVNVDELKSKYLNLEFARSDFFVNAENSATLARLAGETRAEYTDPGHPDFEVFPAYLASLSAGRHLPIDFPSLGGIPVDGGKAVTSLFPVPAGVALNGRTHLHDIYARVAVQVEWFFWSPAWRYLTRQTRSWRYPTVAW